jgi:GT2 family glycosyltransferase|tara:strand:- start:621 stop:1490 length:870 start_codon:yes stop_codon:yes gene_type:complete
MSNFDKKKTPFFSVVIPTYERPDDLAKCLGSLSKENQKSAPSFELIVTDDSCSDLCRNIVKKNFSLVSWGKGKQNGPAGNRNAGVARAQGEWVVFIDDDCIAQPDYLSSYYKAIKENSSVEVLEGRIFPDRSRRTWAEGCPENSGGGMFWTSNLCVKKEVFEELEGFDESFEVAYEDVDFAYRIQKEGKNTLFVKEAAACHPWRTLRQEGNNWKPKGFELQELLHFIRKHPEAKEHSSPLVYLRHLLRMLTSDFSSCLFIYKGKGLDVLSAQIWVTFRVIFKLSKIKFK